MTSREAWLESTVDPVYEEFRNVDSEVLLDRVLNRFPRAQGDPAFDPQLIKGNIERLESMITVDTGHPFLDLSVKTGLAHIDATFQGNHPKYGIKNYGENRCDVFPPIIVAAVDALTAWGIDSRAVQLFQYWIHHFIKQDGTILFYGPSLSEYGQILHTGVLLFERAGEDPWWSSGRLILTRMVNYLLDLCSEAEKNNDLIPGVPESDICTQDPNNVSDSTHNEGNRYFHNNAWIARALLRWTQLMEETTCLSRQETSRMRQTADRLAKRTLSAIEDVCPKEPGSWWLSPQVEAAPEPGSLTSTLLASYTNYRYWPELLSSGILPDHLANRVVNARIHHGGQFCGMTRFDKQLDDWPLADYLYGVWQLGRKSDFFLSLYGHIAYHQAEGHLTAYEQVTFPPGREMCAPYCLPCQLVAARCARLLVG